MNKREISIIICFYNAGKKLADSIKYLKKLSREGIENIEIIFVDNNSNDNSNEIIKKNLKDFEKFPWRIIKESKRGLGNARLKGLNEAKYDILLFCDDDNWLEEDYLEVGIRELEKDSKIAVLGGRGTAISDLELPRWFEENQAFYAVGEPKTITSKKKGQIILVYGAGMFVRKQAFLDIIGKGFHYFSLGRTGKRLSSSEDSEMCLAFLIAGYTLKYESRLKFFHYIEASRLSKEYLKKLELGISRSSFLGKFYLEYLNGYIPRVNKYFWLKELLHSLKDLFIIIFSRYNNTWLKRNVSFCLYLLRERSKYNSNVREAISICKSLDNI